MRKTFYFLLAAVSIFIVVQGCNKPNTDKPSNTSSFDRKAMLTNIGTNIILPAYTAYQVSVNGLDSCVKAFNASPDPAKLTAMQSAFTAAYKQWQAVSPFEFGPAEDINLRVNTNTFPADVNQVNTNIAQNTYNPDLLANLAAKGLPAADYLLFGTGADNTAILQQYTTDGKAANRKNYLALLSAELKTNINTVVSAWNSGYKNTFINSGGTDVGSSIGQMVNQLVYDYEILKNYEIGVPSGVQSMGTTYPQKVQAYYSGISLQLALLHIQALENIYLGKSAQADSLGLDDYLMSAKAKYSDGNALDAVITKQFGAAIARLLALKDPLADNIKNNPAAVAAAYAELQKLTVLLKTDMPSSLGILITYGDNDGD